MSSSSTTLDDQREALLETLHGYKVRTAPSQLFPGQCGVVALAPIAKGESVFPCNGELSNDIINLTFDEVASLPSHSRKLVWAFFQPNQDPRTVPREELTFPVPANGLVHAGNSFFCNSADGTGQDANVETGTVIDGSGYVELVATRDIQIGEELLDSYPIWDYDGSGEFLSTMVGEVDAVEFLGFGISDDEAREILDLRNHMASLKGKVARLEEVKEINEGQIIGLKRQLDSTSSDNRELKTKVARLTEAHQKETEAHQKETEAHQKEIYHLRLTYERAMADLKNAHERKVADLERQAGAASSNSRLWWGCVGRFNSDVGYRDTSTTESESEDDDDSVAGEIAHSVTDYQARPADSVNVDIGTLCLDQGASETVSGSESNGNGIGPSPEDRSLKLREVQGDETHEGIGVIEDATETINQDDGGGDDFPPLPPPPGQVVDAGNLSITNKSGRRNDERWYERLGELREYKEKHGHCNVPQRQGPLGRWVSRQRQEYRKRGKGEQTALTDERAAALEEIGFARDGAHDERWNERLGKLRDYKEENGHCNVPQRQGQLGRWVNEQRKLHRKREKGEQTPLTDERVSALNVLGFEWDGTAAANGGKSNDELWHEWLGELRDYKEENDNCNVPQRQGPLGVWVNTQREYHRKKEAGEQTPLTDERVAALDAIGFQWRLRLKSM